MNIFEEYIKKITDLISKNKQSLNLDNLNDFKGVVVESPPAEFNYDLSCNAGLVLGKINKVNPIELANKIKDLIIKNLKDFEKDFQKRTSKYFRIINEIPFLILFFVLILVIMKPFY